MLDLQNLLTFGGQNMKSKKISHLRYHIKVLLVFWLHSESPLWPYMTLKAFDLEISITWGGHNMKTSFPIWFLVPFLTINGPEGILSPNINDLWRSKYENNENYLSNNTESTRNTCLRESFLNGFAVSVERGLVEVKII